jgi:integrase/recombinase XerD
MVTEAVVLMDERLAGESADFILDPEEVAHGAQAVESYLESLKPGDGRRSAEDALQTLALLFTEGVCDAHEFPWQQVKAYHGAAAVNILREEGTPARLEALRFNRDSTRKYRQVPPAYAAKHVQKLRNSLRRVLIECHKLGFLTEEERAAAIEIPTAAGKGSVRGRILSASEFRALTSACEVGARSQGPRDSLIMSLGYQGGLRVNEICALSLKDMKYDNRRGQVTVYVKGSKDTRGRTVSLQNGALIALEDWLEARGDAPGPLLCPVRKGGKVEVRRLTPTAVRQCCLNCAEKAGVAPFSPNDLRRSAVAARTGGRARRVQEAETASSESQSSALFAAAGEAPPRVGTGAVHFPYRTRKQELF